MEVFKKGLPFEDLEHLFAVVFPVGGAVDVAARTNAGGEHADEGLRDEAALVVTGLAPGIGKVDVHARERIFGDHVADDFNGVVADDAHVLEPHFVEALRKRPHARDEDFTAEEIHLRMRGRDGGRRLAHAAADFENRVGFAPEGRREIERFGTVFDLIAREGFLERALLSGRNVAAAHDEAADVTVLERFELFGREFGFFHGDDRKRNTKIAPRTTRDTTIFCLGESSATSRRRGGGRLERVKGIEPSSLAWEAIALPLSYTRPQRA